VAQRYSVVVLRIMSAKTKFIIFGGVCFVFVLFLLVTSFGHFHDVVQHPNCINNLKQIEWAKQAWAEDYHKTTNDIPTWDDLRNYLKPVLLKCPSGGVYTIGRIGDLPSCSIKNDTALFIKYR